MSVMLTNEFSGGWMNFDLMERFEIATKVLFSVNDWRAFLQSYHFVFHYNNVNWKHVKYWDLTDS